MLRIVTSLLIVLQMLLPPGMCICQFVPQVCAEPLEVKAQDDHPVTSQRSSCCCCHKARATTSGHTDQIRSAARSSSEEGLHSDDAPVHPSHDPDCPALRPADHAEVAETSQPLRLMIAALPHSFVCKTTMPPSTFAWEDAEDDPPERPLYIALRTLLI
jgi:hypothetical protein